MSIERVLNGFAIIGAALTDRAVLAQILSNKHEYLIKYSMYYQITQSLPADEELTTISTKEVNHNYNRFLLYLRMHVNNVVKELNILECNDKKAAAREHSEKLKQQSAVHALGTVAEICAKYNLSKGQVRKMKTDGTLDEYCRNVDLTNSITL